MHIVSVPYRGATFLNPILLILETSKINSFRPLSGSYISQCVYNPYSNYDDGFRPLSGSYISQLNLELWMNGFVMFPSPIGELHFSMIMPASMRRLAQFPSPIGELHFSIFILLYRIFRHTVSVPYRGATFLNLQQLRSA